MLDVFRTVGVGKNADAESSNGEIACHQQIGCADSRFHDGALGAGSLKCPDSIIELLFQNNAAVFQKILGHLGDALRL